MKEKTDLIQNDLDYTYLFKDDITYLIEISYVIGRNHKEEMTEFNKLLEFCTSGIDLYALFVKFCYEKYLFESCDYIEFLRQEITNLIIEFKEKYFEE